MLVRKDPLATRDLQSVRFISRRVGAGSGLIGRETRMGLAQHRLDIHMPQRQQRIRLTWVSILDIAKNRWSCLEFHETSSSKQAVRIQNDR